MLHVPDVSEFFGISIHTLGSVSGDLPPRAFGLVVEWATWHQIAPLPAWKRAEALEPMDRIDPLD